MIRSMTGFGEAERPVEQGRLRVEIKTVNHRFLNTSIRTPPGFDRVEHDVQKWLRSHLSRGHASVSVNVDRDDEAGRDDLPEVDLERARHYAGLLRTLSRELGLPGDPDVSALLRFNDILRTPEPSRTAPSIPVELLREVVEEACAAVVTMREAEGRRLRADMEARLDAIGRALDTVEARAPERLTAERDRLREQVAELTASAEVDEDRLAREVAYLAEKWDINEEVVRFRSHVELFRETLDADSAEPVGKRLSFVVQEMHREANTIGSKANDADISQAAVAMKEEIERLREQVENVE